MKRPNIVMALCLAALAACDSPSAEPSKDPSPTKKSSAPAAAPVPKKPTPPPKKEPTKELLDPSLSKEKAPDTFRAKFSTTKGDFVLEVVRAWAPNGADRFYNLVKIGFFEDVALFRVVEGFVVQFGIHGDPRVSGKWSSSNIAPDDPKGSNTRGMLTYAMAGSPDTRSTQLFINFGDNSRLDKMGFAPIGKVVEGMDVVDKFYKGYGERATREQTNITQKGNDFLRENYPELDYINRAVLVTDAAADAGKTGEPGKEGAAPSKSAAPTKTAAPKADSPKKAGDAKSD